MVDKITAIKRLSAFIGVDLMEKAEEFGITTFVNGKQNKGWKGQVLERLAGLSNDNAQAPDGLDFELKSTAYRQLRGKWDPKETMAITMIKEKDLVSTPFYKSHCWEKLSSVIFCAVTWNGLHDPKAELLQIDALDFTEDGKLINEIEKDYELIRAKCARDGFGALTSSDGKWIQTRTKGPGHGSTSRAFYARKEFLREVIKFD